VSVIGRVARGLGGVARDVGGVASGPVTRCVVEDSSSIPIPTFDACRRKQCHDDESGRHRKLTARDSKFDAVASTVATADAMSALQDIVSTAEDSILDEVAKSVGSGFVVASTSTAGVATCIFSGVANISVGHSS
jgi:hypothetical protein